MHWLNEKTLAPLFEVNEHLIELMPFGPPGARLHLIDSESRQRMARCPFLLIEAGLQHPQQWSSTNDTEPPFFTRDEAIPLAQMTFVLAWSMARMNREVACVVLGISQNAANFLGTLALRDLQRTAENRWWSIRPRWADRPSIWQRLALGDTRSTDSALHPTSALRSLQLLFWELVHATP